MLMRSMLMRSFLIRLFAALSLTGGLDSIVRAGEHVNYSRDVRPILSRYCFQCHGPDEAARQAELRLDSSEGATSELPSGSIAVVAGAPAASELVLRLTSDDPDLAMPPQKLGKTVSPREVDILRQWIADGAKYAQHWAYVRPVRPEIPAVHQSSWPINGIDYFVLAQLEHQQLAPVPRADRATLLRRAAFDLTGLPPNDADLAAFLHDERPEAWEAAIDRLLASPAYGERWASMWLDLARYADSSGYIHDPPRTIWRWRDWLIQALNDNLPYDQLTREMLAGDLLPDPTDDQLIATGFHRNTTTNTEGGANAAEYQFAAVVDRVNTTLQVWMGTTIACAQCHNHKYDPFTQVEYYQLLAILNNTIDLNSEPPVREVARVGQQAAFRELQPEWMTARDELEAITKQLDMAFPAWQLAVARETLPADIAEILSVAADQRSATQTEKLKSHHRQTDEGWKRAEARERQLKAQLDDVATTTLILQEGPPKETFVAIRGEFNNRGPAVAPGFPAALHPAPADQAVNRMTLANWLMDARNPLTARVAVNRFWQEIFGIGIVETSEEFGLQGEPPSHPELLDWLATEYLRLGWDSKQLLKVILMSATYQQASTANSDLLRDDPQNRLLARGPRLRLSAEAIRDQALAVSGLLSSKQYGPPVHPFQPVNGLAAAFGPSTDWSTSPGEDAHRRALYTRWRRNLPYPSLLAFDVPERAVCSVRRIRTNTPVQALVTLNDPVFVEAAQALGRRLFFSSQTLDERLAKAYPTVLRREATVDELRRLRGLYDEATANLSADPDRANKLASEPLGPIPAGVDAVELAVWTVVGNVLLNLDETLSRR